MSVAVLACSHEQYAMIGGHLWLFYGISASKMQPNRGNFLRGIESVWTILSGIAVQLLYGRQLVLSPTQ